MIGKLAVATVSSGEFALGSAVALASFRQTNRWFDGDFVVIAAGLAEKQRALIEAGGPVQFREPSSELRDRIDTLCDARPDLGPKRLRFYSLESFALNGYDKVLFLDSDTVVTGDFEELFSRPEPFIAASDNATLRGKRRDRTSFAPVAEDDPDGLAGFNAGMMQIGCELLNEEVFGDLLALLDTAEWAGVETHHTDQLVLNRRFAGQATLVDHSYNLTIGHRNSGELWQGRALDEVRMFHFNGPRKPWLPERIADRAIEDPAVGYGLAKWHRAFERMVAEGHLARVAQGGS